MKFQDIGPARIVKRNEVLLNHFEAELRDSFGEDYSEKFLEYCDRHAEIEIGFLGLKSSANSCLEYQVYLERMKRFKREHLIRGLIDSCHEYSITEDVSIEQAIQIIKDTWKNPNDFEIFERVYQAYRMNS